MGNKNNRGRPQQIPVAQQIAKRQLDAKRVAEKAIASQLHQQELADQEKLARAKQYALDFDFKSLPQHSALHVEKNSGMAKLFIKIDIIHPRFTAKEVNFLTILPKYAAMIRNVEVLLIAPARHESVEVYNLRLRNMTRTIDILNTFDLDELDFVVSLNRPDNFMQMKLAAACFGLKFKEWTMSATIFGDKEKGFKIGVGSPTARRLHGVYKSEFLTQKSVITADWGGGRCCRFLGGLQKSLFRWLLG